MSLIRLDKYIAATLVIGRKDAAKYIRSGYVTVNGQAAKLSDMKIDSECDSVTFDGKSIAYSEHLYIMLNKPAGLICALEDKRDKTVMSLFPEEYTDKGISTVGRLDKDTVGLLILTNDGALAHKLLSPKKHIPKKYFVTCDKPFVHEDIETVRKGILIDGKNTAPAILEICKDNPNRAYMTLTEGKFHEVKRLCYACGEKEVTRLERLEFAGLTLDSSLAYGEWRNLSKDEISLLKSNDS